MSVDARVTVRLRPEVLDAAGTAVGQALKDLGFPVSSVRIGKIIELSIETEDPAEAERLCRRMAERLLANPVLETFSIEVQG